jgi:hypothetical protein
MKINAITDPTTKNPPIRNLMNLMLRFLSIHPSIVAVRSNYGFSIPVTTPYLNPPTTIASGANYFSQTVTFRTLFKLPIKTEVKVLIAWDFAFAFTLGTY